MVLDQECLHQVEKKYLSEEDKKEEKNCLLKNITSLKKRSEFLFIRKFGETIHSKYFIVNFLYKPNSEIRIGLTVSRKIGNAVKRNYLKRIIRSLLKENISIIPKYILSEIIPKKNIEKTKYIDLKTDLIKVFKNLKF
tara:strand:- start:657 stop:1070 length:414 start_codon:yes stop_codon:yes gene_type:complete